MEQITASPETLVNQAWKTAAEYLDHAIEQVDVRFGAGFSKKHPELVVAMLHASAVDLHAMANAEALRGIADAIAQRSSE